MFAGEIFLAALSLITATALALINNLIKEGSLTHGHFKKGATLIELSEKITYLSENSAGENSQDNCRNSLIFKQITGKRAPIRLINRILNCYDPIVAMYIYSRASRYMQFKRDELGTWQLERPRTIDNPLLNLLLWLLLISGVALFVAGVYAFSLIVITLQVQIVEPTAIAPFRSFMVFFLISAVVGIVFVREASRERAFLKLVKTFYEDKPNTQRKFIRTVFNGARVKVNANSR